jgi:erythromycin esterase-like protein
MHPTKDPQLAKQLRETISKNLHPVRLNDNASSYDALIDAVGDAQIVLIGEASHGTHEFYEERAQISQRLIAEKGFTCVCVESDWPDAYRVNRYLHGILTKDKSVEEALSSYLRFPRWMWRNTVVVDFLGWACKFNSGRPLPQKVSFLGMDLYSLYTSAYEVIKYLDEVDPEAAKRARQRYSAFLAFGEDTQSYGYSASMGLTKSAEDGCLKVLKDMLNHSRDYLKPDGYIAKDELFYNTQNAVVVADAEKYYRTMFSKRDISWNLRDEHMVNTLLATLKHQREFGDPNAKIIVWAHNSHLGDARATEMSERGELNVGQLVRERFGNDNSYSIGFSTHTGTVTAADGWDQAPKKKKVVPSMPDSVENVLHDVARSSKAPNHYLIFNKVQSDGKRAVDPQLNKLLSRPLLGRAIGVIYKPATERWSHYGYAKASEQYDALIHIDHTKALQPLDTTFDPMMEDETVPETFPEGL